MLAHLEAKRGFTVIELMVSVAIFAMMTILVVAKYSTFNDSVLFSNLAYDIALTIRTAQTYGLSVQGQTKEGSAVFTYPYGVTFCALSSCSGANGTTFTNKDIILFADTNTGNPLTDPRGGYDTLDTAVQKYAIKRGAKISAIKTEDSSGNFVYRPSNSRVDITFVRPNPNATICVNTSGDSLPPICYEGGSGSEAPAAAVAIEVKALDGSTRDIVIRRNGLISLEDTK